MSTGAGRSLEGWRVLYLVNVDWFFLSHRLPLAVAAKQRGAEVWVAAADTGRGREVEQQGLRFVSIPLSRGSTNPLRELRTVVRIVRLLAAIRPTLVHNVTTKPVLYGSLAARAAARDAAVVNAITGFGYTFGSQGRGWLRRLVLGAYRAALRHPRSRTIFQNSEDLEDFVARGMVARDRAVLIRGSGVDCDAFHPAPEPDGPPMVVLSSRMLWEKGVADFVEAATRIKAVRPEARFVLVGSPDPANPRSIPVETLQEWSRQGVVEWWGHRDDMPEVLRRAHVVVLPTFYKEGVPKVLIEAAASARPVVTTDVPGCRDIVQHGVNGLLVPPHDPVALSAAIISLLSSNATRLRMGERGRRHALEHFKIEAVIRETFAVYEEFVPTSARAPAVEHGP